MTALTRAEAEAEFATAIAQHDLDRAMAVAAVIDKMPAPRPPSIIGAALWYAEHGLPVFPLMPGSKVPYPRTRGVKDATTDPEAVRAALADKPAANLGLATGHRVDVIDFDGPEAHGAWSAEFGADWANADVTVLATVSTPRAGGLHVYVPATGAGNKAGFLPHVDYRGLGGYVVAPPSITPNGTYRFLRPLDPETLP